MGRQTAEALSSSRAEDLAEGVEPADERSVLMDGATFGAEEKAGPVRLEAEDGAFFGVIVQKFGGCHLQISRQPQDIIRSYGDRFVRTAEGANPAPERERALPVQVKPE